MTEKQAVEIIYEGLVGERSLPVKLGSREGFDEAQFDLVKSAAEFLIQAWRGRESVPKRVAIAFVDVQTSMLLGWAPYPEDEQRIEDAANELVDLGYRLLDPDPSVE